VVDNLNLTALDAVYGDEPRGQPPYDPRMMTKVLVYGYCVGVFSSRRMYMHSLRFAISTGHRPRLCYLSQRSGSDILATRRQRHVFISLFPIDRLVRHSG
jgi:Transposase domain (DUF772)